MAVLDRHVGKEEKRSKHVRGRGGKGEIVGGFLDEGRGANGETVGDPPPGGSRGEGLNSDEPGRQRGGKNASEGGGERARFISS